MIGKIYSSVTPFYDSSSQTPSYKKLDEFNQEIFHNAI